MDDTVYNKILQTVNIVDVFTYFGFDIKKRGKEFVTNCPFHPDHHPSMTIVPYKNFCKCFACGDKAMMPLQFIRRYKNVDNNEALKIMANIGNIYIESNTNSDFKFVKEEKSIIKTTDIHPSYTDMDIVNVSINNQLYPKNPLFQRLSNQFGNELVNIVFQQYKVGTSSHQVNKNQGNRLSVVFWQVDIDNKVRGGKIIPYDETAHRIKGYPDATWYHSINNNQKYNLHQCIFGEHLLSKDGIDVVNIVESEKTAIVQCVRNFRLNPTAIWLATGGKCAQSLIRNRIKVLNDYPVVLWPDADAYDAWLDIADDLLDAGIDVSIDKTLLNAGIDPNSKMDIADFVLDF